MILVRENFRYPNGQVAAGQSILVYNRGTTVKPSMFTNEAGSTAASNPILTDAVGNLSFYIAPGAYDFFVFGVRVPFDVDAALSVPSYTHIQTISNATWTIIHNLGFNPQVSVIIGGVEVIADVDWPDINTVIVHLDVPRMGSAYLS